MSRLNVCSLLSKCRHVKESYKRTCYSQFRFLVTSSNFAQRPKPSGPPDNSEPTSSDAAHEASRGAFFDVQFDSPPVLFIQKYGRLVDTKDVIIPHEQTDALSEMEKDTALSLEETITQKKIKHILKTLQHTKTFEALSAKLKEKHEPLLSPSIKAGADTHVQDSIFTDVEYISQPKSDVHLEKDKDAEVYQWMESKVNLRKLPTYYLMLSKSRLTLLVCITSAAGYGMAPGAFDPTLFLLSTIGTGLFSCSANSINQLMEVPFDSQMNRTKNRVLVRGFLTPRHAFGFAIGTAAMGAYILGCHVNTIAMGLGFLNLFLYTSVYTPMKRTTIANTWVGSVVGAIPPVIGWVSCTGTLDAGALIPAGILFAWQFPHFNSLSWNLRPDYSRAGYRMMSVTNPELCKRVALRYSVGCIAICTAAPVLGVTEAFFAVDSLPLNLYLTYLSWKFYKNADSASSRKLFRFTLIHLPLLMTLLFISKKRNTTEEEKNVT